MSQISYKVILIGNSGVGKTAIYQKLHKGRFFESNISTIGVVKKNLSVQLEVDENGKRVKKEFDIMLHDTAGQEKFRAITFNYYKASDGILLVYDITERESFENVEIWISSLKDTLGDIQDSKYVVILIGNKLDLVEKDESVRMVTEEEAKKICEQHHMIWGGEQSIKDIEFEQLQYLFKEYVTYIYERVGEKKAGKQNLKKIQKYNKKFNCGSCLK